MSHRPVSNTGKPPDDRINGFLDEVLAWLHTSRPGLFRSWFDRLRLASLAGGQVEIVAVNAAQARYLEERCKSAFMEAAQAVTGRLVSVSFNTDAPAGSSNEEEKPGPIRWECRAALNPAFTFDRFVAGPCNRLARSAATAVADRPGEVYNPFFIYGPAGLGKTHLLQGIVHAAASQGDDRSCLYLSCSMFVNHAVRAMEETGSCLLCDLYDGVSLLAVDDVHLLAGRERSQEGFFNVLNDLLTSQRQIVVSADRPPSEIGGLHERLLSRLSAGLVVALDSPCLETRMAIVREKATVLAVELPEEVIGFLAQRCERDVGRLAKALERMDALSTFEAHPISIELADRVFTQDREESEEKAGQVRLEFL